MSSWSWMATIKKWWNNSKAYPSTDSSNIITEGFRPGDYAASDLANDLPLLRAQCRALERGHDEAKAACHGLVANIVGMGIALAVDSGDEETDQKLQLVWDKWVKRCGTNGQSLYQLQAMAVREMVVAGEFLWRLVTIDDGRKIPSTRVLVLESEWICSTSTMADLNDGSQLIGGIRWDRLGRPISYELSDPRLGIGAGQVETVPASMVIHGFEPTRALQARGEPWMSSVITTMLQTRRLVTAELRAAENTAALSAVLKPKGSPPGMTTKADGTQRLDLKPGSIGILKPGDDLQVIQNSRPSQQIAPFCAFLRGNLAGALRLGQRWFDRDASRANYSSSRADQQDSEKLLRPVREWLGEITAGRLFEAILPELALIAGVRITGPIDYRIIPDGTPYIDPQKDIAAASDSINQGLSTKEAEIGARGGDAKQIAAQRIREQAAEDTASIDRIRAVQRQCEQFNLEFPGIGLTWAHVLAIGGATSAPGAFLAAASKQQEVTTEASVEDPESSEEDTESAEEDDPESAEEDQVD